MQIRAETAADLEAVAELTEAAFGRPAEARLVEAIRDSDGYLAELSLVAELEGRVVAHAMLSTVALEGCGTEVLALAPVSVHPESQRRRIGSALVRELLRRADQRGERLVIVLGMPRSPRASAFAGRRSWGSCRPIPRSRTMPGWPSRCAPTSRPCAAVCSTRRRSTRRAWSRRREERAHRPVVVLAERLGS